MPGANLGHLHEGLIYFENTHMAMDILPASKKTDFSLASEPLEIGVNVNGGE